MIGTLARRRQFRPSPPNASTQQDPAAAAFATELGWLAIAWQDAALLGTVFGYDSPHEANQALARLLQLPQARVCCKLQEEAMRDEPPWIVGPVERLRQFANGEPVDFDDVPLALEHLTPFGRRVISACRRIPWGHTRSYGQLAADCNSPGAARAVGSVMARNRFPLVVPCHRVVGSAGSLGGYSAPGGLLMKRRLLEMEAAPIGASQASSSAPQPNIWPSSRR